MNTWLQKLTDISSIAQPDWFKNSLTDLARELGFNCYAYLNVHPIRTFAISNYPEEWQARYLARDYARVDPVVSTARSRMRAFSWAATDPRRAATAEVRAFYSEAADFGIRSGISIPVRTAFGHMSMLTLASDKQLLSAERDIDQVAAATAVALLHAAIDRRDVEPTAHATIAITAKQAVCLAWSAEGKTMKDIAVIEGMSYATVNFHLNNARKALDASSLSQATALATRLKLI